MRVRGLQKSGIVLLLTAAMAEAVRSEPKKEASGQLVGLLIDQLGRGSFREREAVGKQIAGLGEEILPALRKAADTHPDLEVRQRTFKLIRTIMQNCRKSKSTGLEMVVVDVGEFQMGSPKSEYGRRPDESPHRVRITRPYLLGAYEVTQAEFQQVLKFNPSWFAATGPGKDKVARMDKASAH